MHGRVTKGGGAISRGRVAPRGKLTVCVQVGGMQPPRPRDHLEAQDCLPARSRLPIHTLPVPASGDRGPGTGAPWTLLSWLMERVQPPVILMSSVGGRERSHCAQGGPRGCQGCALDPFLPRVPLAFIKHLLCARRVQLGTASLRWNPMHHRKAGATLFRNRALAARLWAVRGGGV